MCKSFCEVNLVGEVLECHVLVPKASEKLLDILLMFWQEGAFLLKTDAFMILR